MKIWNEKLGAPGGPNEFGLGLCEGTEPCASWDTPAARCFFPLQLESQNYCSMLSNFSYNLPTGEAEISLLVFPCFLFSREQFFSCYYKSWENESWLVFRGTECLQHHLEPVWAAKQLNSTENLPLFRPSPFCTALHMNSAQKILSDEDPVGMHINYIFHCVPTGMDCIFLQREARWFLLQMNQNLESGHALHFPWQPWLEWRILIRI